MILGSVVVQLPRHFGLIGGQNREVHAPILPAPPRSSTEKGEGGGLIEYNWSSTQVQALLCGPESKLSGCLLKVQRLPLSSKLKFTS